MNNYRSLLYPALVLVFLIVFTILAWFSIFSIVSDESIVSGGQRTPRIEMLIELSKALAQLIFVTLIGATTASIYSQYAKDKENSKLRLQEDNKLRRDLLNSLIDVRSQVEETRREFRLLPLDERREGYDCAIQNLLQARLNLSQVWHGTETWKELYLEDSQTIQSGLTAMKEYLDKLIDEYEPKIEDEDVNEEEGKSTNQMIANSPLFATFVGGDGGEVYTKNFLERDYRNAARMIRKHLLPPD
jgi:hypothetical protein